MYKELKARIDNLERQLNALASRNVNERVDTVKGTTISLQGETTEIKISVNDLDEELAKTALELTKMIYGKENK